MSFDNNRYDEPRGGPPSDREAFEDHFPRERELRAALTVDAQYRDATDADWAALTARLDASGADAGGGNGDGTGTGTGTGTNPAQRPGEMTPATSKPARHWRGPLLAAAAVAALTISITAVATRDNSGQHAATSQADGALDRDASADDAGPADQDTAGQVDPEFDRAFDSAVGPNGENGPFVASEITDPDGDYTTALLEGTVSLTNGCVTIKSTGHVFTPIFPAHQLEKATAPAVLVWAGRSYAVGDTIAVGGGAVAKDGRVTLPGWSEACPANAWAVSP